MCHALLRDASLYEQLLAFDHDLAADARAAGCAFCAGILHSARYPRKPRGGLEDLGPDYTTRLSFCCAADGCRRRTTPASVRYLGRRVYLGAVVVLVTAMVGGITASRAAQLREWLGVSVRTLKRWRVWWREAFVASAFWRGAQGRFMPPVATATLPASLLARFAGVWQMKAFYLAWRNPQTSSAESGGQGILQTLSAESSLARLAARFLLPWPAYVRLLAVKNEHARRFSEAEALRGGWSVRQLDRQIESQFYERTAPSKNKAALLARGARKQDADAVTPEEEIKDPYVLEFLDLKDEYSETDLEAALIGRLETFLLELGGDFCVVGRQRRLRIGDAWYRLDVLFFHRRLRCLVVVDLKLGRFTHADAGQMHLYLNYAQAHWTRPGENPPVGLILCARKDEALALRPGQPPEQGHGGRVSNRAAGRTPDRRGTQPLAQGARVAAGTPDARAEGQMRREMCAQVVDAGRAGRDEVH